MTARYTIGGISFIVDEPLPDLESDGFADAELHVRYTESGTPAPIGEDGVRLVSGPAGLTGSIDPLARDCWLPTTHPEPDGRAWQLRQMAPIFSAVAERLVLHAGAVAVNGSIVTFVGASGAGKTTLARFMEGRGHEYAADDLLPIRFDPLPSGPVADRLLPIGAICFLARSRTVGVDISRLSPVAALQELAAHGFGEHGDRETWAFQFDAYHRIADAVPAFELTIPDDLASLPDVEAALTALVSDPSHLPFVDREI